MREYRISVTDHDLDNYERYLEFVADYPLYASTCGLTRSQIVFLGKFMESGLLGLNNDAEVEVIFKVREAKSASTR